MCLVKKFYQNEEGATAIEYGLIAGILAVSIVAGASLIGNTINNTFNTLGTAVESNGDNLK